MRALILALAAGWAMAGETRVGGAAPPKDELKPPYTEQVTVRRWRAPEKAFQNLHEGVHAWRKTNKDGQLVFNLRARDTVGGKPPENTQIVDKDGAAYVVEKAFDDAPDYTCWVKPLPKAP